MEIREYKLMFEVEDTHFWYKGMRKITNTLLEKYLPKNNRQKILDAGCGTGKNIMFLKKYGKVSGFDISSQAITYCKKRKLTNIKLGSIDEIPYKNNVFDLVTCFDVLGQIEVRNINKSIKEFKRVLKPGGILLIRVAAYDWLKGYHDKAVHTKHRFKKNELEKLLTINNLKVIKTSYANCLLLPISILKRLLNKTIDSDVKQINPQVNWFLNMPFVLESLFLKYFSLPFGLSVIIVAKK